MAKKLVEVKPTIYRFMCERTNNQNYHTDFNSKEEGLKYIESLNDPKISWYGLYELDEVKDRLNTIVSKRLIQLPNTISKQSENQNTKKTRKKSK